MSLITSARLGLGVWKYPKNRLRIRTLETEQHEQGMMSFKFLKEVASVQFLCSCMNYYLLLNYFCFAGGNRGNKISTNCSTLQLLVRDGRVHLFRTLRSRIIKHKSTVNRQDESQLLDALFIQQRHSSTDFNGECDELKFPKRRVVIIIASFHKWRPKRCSAWPSYFMAGSLKV